MTPSAPAKILVMTYDEWEAKYQPQPNRLASHGSYDGRMYETFGKEQDRAWATYQKTPTLVWTVLDDGISILPGWHRVNRLGHFLCKVPFEHENLQVCDNPEEWFTQLRREGSLRHTQATMEFSPGMQKELAEWRAAAGSRRSPPSP